MKRIPKLHDYVRLDVGRIDYESIDSVIEKFQNVKLLIPLKYLDDVKVVIEKDYSGCYYEGDTPTLSVVVTYTEEESDEDYAIRVEKIKEEEKIANRKRSAEIKAKELAEYERLKKKFERS